VGEFFDSITGSEIGLGFEQVEVRAGSPLVGKKLRETPLRAELDVVIISILRGSGDTLIAIGQVESMERLNELASGTES